MHASKFFLIAILALSAPVRGADRGDRCVALEKRVAELDAEIRRLRAESTTFKALNDGGFYRPHEHVGEDLGGEFAAVLGLDQKQLSAVNAVYGDTHRKLAAAIAKQKPATNKSKGKITITIEDFFLADGVAVERDFKRRLIEVLAPERAQFLLRARGSFDDRRFLEFGKGTWTFTVKPVGGSGRVEYEIERKTSSSSFSPFSSGSDLMLPEDFALVKAYLPTSVGGDADDSAREHGR